MATYTPNLNLKKPDGSDYVLVGDFNTNSATLDTSIGALSSLNTTVKTSIVAAINEARLTGGNNAPYIGDNYNWYEWNDTTSEYDDTGVQAPGGLWYTGTGITGTSETPSVFSTGITYANSYDLYFNTETANIYVCDTAGDDDTATWYYLCNIQGIQGETGDTGASIVSGAFVGDDLVFTKDDTSTVTIEDAKIDLKGDQGLKGDTGDQGYHVDTVTRTSGTGAAGTTDTYTMYLNDPSDTVAGTFNVYNGADGAGSGDMLKATYDADNDGVVDNAEALGGVAASGYALEINGQSAFTDIADADYVPVYDTSATAQKKSLWSNIRSVLKTYFDTVYQAVITGGATTIASSNLTASKALASDSSGKVAVSAVTSTELGYVSGVTSAIQTQIDGKLGTSGAGTSVTVTFTEASSQAAPATGETLAVLWGKFLKWYNTAAWTTTTDTSSTTPTISTAANHTKYVYTQSLTSLTISANPSGDFDYIIEFTAGGAFTPTYAATPLWNGDTAPTITSGKRYCLIISNRISSYGQTTP